MDANFALDGAPPSAFTYDWESQCYTRDPDGCYNMSVYNTQSLTYGTHVLNITMLTYQSPGITLPGARYSDFWFDYAVIFTGSSNRWSQYVFLPPCSSDWLKCYSTQLVAVYSGTFGGGILIAVLIVFYYCKRRYQRQWPHAEVDLEPVQSSFQPTMFVTNTPLNRDALRDWSPTSLVQEDTDLHNSQISPPPIPPKSNIQSPTSQSCSNLIGGSHWDKWIHSRQTAVDIICTHMY